MRVPPVLIHSDRIIQLLGYPDLWKPRMYIFFLIMPLDSSIPGMVIGGDDRSPDDERIYQYILVLQAPTPTGSILF